MPPRRSKGFFSSLLALRTDRLEPIRRFSGWVRDQNDMGVAYPNITAEVKSRVARMQIPRLRERANRALLALIKKGCRIGTEISPYMSHAPDLQGRTYSKDADELIALLHILCDDGLLTDGPSWSLNSRALIAAEDLSFGGGSSAQGFVAMSFDSTIDDAWTNGFDPAIRAAGFSALRLDDKDYIGGVSDQIIAEVRRSRFRGCRLHPAE